MRSICLLLFCFIGLPFSTYSLITIKGNDQTNQTTFTFSVGNIAEDSNNYFLYTAAQAHEAGTANEFAISLIDQTIGTCTPLTPETVTLNITEHNQPNPLYDAVFKDVAVMQLAGESLPVVLLQNNLTQIFMFESTFPSHISILQSAIINDAHTTPTPAVNLSLLATDNNGHIVTCTTPASLTFGDDGSGIAVVVRGFKKENDVQVRAFQQINAVTGNTEDPAIALPFDRNSSFLTFENNALADMTPTVFWWDDSLQRLYIGISGTSSANANGGIRSIAVGRFSGHQLIVEEFVSETAFDGTNNDLLMGKKGSNQTTNIIDIITMHTSGRTAYLVIRGENNTSADIQVIPVVQSNDPTTQGKVADKNSPSEDIFAPGGGNIATYQKTITPVPAILPSQLPTLVDPATIPGGGIVLQGTISSMKTVGDTFYVSTDNSTDPALNGMYQSTAIIENINGKIVGWTEWQPVFAPNSSTHFATVNRKTGTINMLIEDNFGSKNSILQTQWQMATKNNSTIAPLNDFLQIASNGTILQKFLYLPATTPGIAAGSCGMFLYQQSFALAFLTHTEVDNIQRQTTQDEFTNTQTVHQDTQTITYNANTLFFNKNKLADIGIPTCACIAHTTTTDDAWFILGGTQGIAILSTATGRGWSIAQDIGDNFINLPEDYTTVTTLLMNNIQKLAAVDGFLFVLTDTQVLRLPLAPASLLQAPITTIADINQAPFGNAQAFTDLLVAEPVALLGTTHGLWVNLPGSTIIDLDNASSWQQIVLPESVVAIQKCTVTNKTGYDGDSTNNQGAIIYISTIDRPQKAGRVHRLYCSPASNAVVEDNTVQLFNDRRLEDVPSHLLDLGSVYETICTNGNTYFSVKNNNGSSNAHFSLAAPKTVDGSNPYIGLTQWIIPLFLHAPIAGLHCIAGHGGMIIADSQQLYVNQ